MSSKLLPLEAIKTVGLVGAGSVGSAWAALMLAAGYDVVVYDVNAAAENNFREAVLAAWPAVRSLHPNAAPEAPFSRTRFVDSIEALATASDLVQENVAEALTIKHQVLSRLDAALPPSRLILSSSGGVPPSQLQRSCAYPERVLLGHPFHPAYLIPLVEVVGGDATSEESIDLAMRFYSQLGKRPIRLRREMVGHLSNRLQFAVLREAIHCLNEEVASASDIDAAVRWGVGLRWALMGPLMTLNLAGGPGGIEQLIARFKDDIQTWWDALGSPSLTPDVCTKLFEGIEELRAGMTNQQWAEWRDSELADLMRFRSVHPYLAETQVANQEH